MTIHNPKVSPDTELKTFVNCEAKVVTFIGGADGAVVQIVNETGSIVRIHLFRGETLTVVE